MNQKKEWSKIAERILTTGVTPHFAPREETLKVHLSHINNLKTQNKKPNVVVLGATPELADLALKHQCMVYRVDNNPAMFDAAKPREKITDRKNETIIHNNWSDINLISDGKIDLVMGDASLNNVPTAQMLQVLNELNRITHSGSILSLKQIILPDRNINDFTL
ncbi:MAG: class I SAM-dependent methyltransferase, partial [Gammaproteobacteria bacterium]|nr:class I SAM-dependent methyltransferase [Gammaproteobacteria bacterium]